MIILKKKNAETETNAQIFLLNRPIEPIQSLGCDVCVQPTVQNGSVTVAVGVSDR